MRVRAGSRFTLNHFAVLMVIINIYSKNFLSIYYVPGVAVGAGDATVDQTDKSTCSHGADIPMRK